MLIIAFFVKLKTRLKRRGDLLFKKNPNVFVGIDIRIQFFESVGKKDILYNSKFHKLNHNPRVLK
jgi:hypothetical protein